MLPGVSAACTSTSARWKRCKLRTRRTKKTTAHRVLTGVTFEAIEERGVEGLLEQIRDELTRRTYIRAAARKREIPKDGGKKVRVLSITCIRDRVVQEALKLILEPI